MQSSKTKTNKQTKHKNPKVLLMIRNRLQERNKVYNSMYSMFPLCKSGHTHTCPHVHLYIRIILESYTRNTKHWLTLSTCTYTSLFMCRGTEGRGKKRTFIVFPFLLFAFFSHVLLFNKNKLINKRKYPYWEGIKSIELFISYYIQTNSWWIKILQF